MFVAGKRVGGQKKQVKILIVDDHPVVRYGISRIINQAPGLSVCGEAEDAKHALQFLRGSMPDIILLDISLGGDIDGLQFIRMLRAKYSELPILILSMHDESRYAQQAMRSGANGYIMKDESPEKLIYAIGVILKGGIYLDEDIRERVLLTLSRPQDSDEHITDRLSDREREVFRMTGAGMLTRDIAEKLCISVKTVETHRGRIKQKLGIRSAPELVVAAVSWNNRFADTGRPGVN